MKKLSPLNNRIILIIVNCLLKCT